MRTEDQERHVRVSAGELAGLVRRIGGDGDRFLVVQRVPDLPDVFTQVWHKAGGDYTLEHRDGAADRHFQAIVDGPEAVVAAMTRWARQEPGWDAGLPWSLLAMGPVPEVPPRDVSLDIRRRRPDAVADLLDRAGLPVHARFHRAPEAGEPSPRAFLLARRAPRAAPH